MTKILLPPLPYNWVQITALEVMITYSKILAAMALVMLSSTAFVYARNAQNYGNTIRYSSRCGPGEPALGIQRYRLHTWTEQFKKSIELQPQYGELVELIRSPSDPDCFTSCHFTTNADGSIKDLNVEHSSCSNKDVARLLLKLIENVPPSVPPKNVLTSTAGVDVIFQKIVIDNTKSVPNFRVDIGSTERLDDEQLKSVEKTAREEEAALAKVAP